MKLLLDMNLTPRWVPYLESAGIEALHWSKVGRANAPDEEIMAYAAGLGLVVNGTQRLPKFGIAPLLSLPDSLLPLLHLQIFLLMKIHRILPVRIYPTTILHHHHHLLQQPHT